MDFEAIKQNLLNAFNQLLALRLIVTSPKEKIVDLPALYVLFAALLAPGACAVTVVLGLIFHYHARFEKDAAKV